MRTAPRRRARSNFFLKRTLAPPRRAVPAMDLGALEGGVAVLTGAGSVTGLGFALAKQAAALGMHVLISDVRPAAVDEAVQALAEDVALHGGGVTVKGSPCDVGDFASVERLLGAACGSFGGAPIRFVAANAGVLFPKTTVLASQGAIRCTASPRCSGT